MKPKAYCCKCGEPIRPFTAICYTDQKQGWKDQPIHRACYRAHILENFSGGRLAEWLRKHPDEYTEEEDKQLAMYGYC